MLMHMKKGSRHYHQPCIIWRWDNDGLDPGLVLNFAWFKDMACWILLQSAKISLNDFCICMGSLSESKRFFCRVTVVKLHFKQSFTVSDVRALSRSVCFSGVSKSFERARSFCDFASGVVIAESLLVRFVGTGGGSINAERLSTTMGG